MDEVKLEREALIDVAMGYEPADMAIINGHLVNVHTGRIQSDSIAIKGSRIAAVGDIGYAIGDETEVIDADGQFLVPGLVDPHTHQWHTYTNSTVFAAGRLLHGCTAIAAGFYGHAIVNGMKAVRFFLDELLRTPVKPIFLVPTMCYVQNRCLGLPSSPNAPTIEDLFEMLNYPETKGIEETGFEYMLDRERRDRGLLQLIEECLRQGKVPTGHSAGMYEDRGLNGFIAAGIMNNHEIVFLGDAQRQAELGLHVLIREGSACSDVRQLLPAITDRGYASRAFQLNTDVTTPDWAVERGQIDHVVRVAIRNGLDPIKAIQMSTIQPAEFFRVNHDMGVIAAGRFADILFVEHLADFQISKVIANGEVWVEGGKLIRQLQQPEYPEWLYGTMNVGRILKAEDFRISAPADAEKTVNVRVITTRDGSLETPESVEALSVVDGFIQADPGRGINKIAMIDRIFGTGEIGLAFVKGFNIQDGCIGTTANVLNENLVLVGSSDEDMAVAANETVNMGGGFVAVRQRRLLTSFPTPLNGLVTDLSFDETIESVNRLLATWRDMGCNLETPKMNLEFVTLVPIPYLKICTKGLALIQGQEYDLVNLVV
ncbi:MAG: adenine deaminase [Planctomycetes bacterium]|nr:adenine deaminase [Planctomycetota bacterium]